MLIVGDGCGCADRLLDRTLDRIRALRQWGDLLTEIERDIDLIR